MQPNWGTQTDPKPPVMSQKLALGCLALFTLPFVAAGVTAVGSGILQLMQGAPTTTALPLVALGTVFLAAAPAMFTAVMKGMRASAADAAVRAQNPDKPWFWRKEWADGVMTDRKATASWILFGFAIVFVAVSSPMLFVLRREIDKGNNLALVVLLFPLAGASLLVTALYHLMRVRKYGESRSRLDRIPIEPGSAFRGDIETHVTENPPDGFLLKLTCVRRVTTGAGKRRSTTESILWRDEQTVRASMPMPDGLRIPYTFTIPADAEPSDERNSDNRIVWRLDVGAQVPGIDYAAQFELPVFDVSGSPHPAEHYAHPAIADVASWQPSPDSLITMSPTAEGGEEIRVRTHPHFREAVGLGVFCLLWFGFIALMITLHSPLFLPIVFSAFGLILLLLLFDFAFGRTVIRATRNALTLRREWLGLHTSRSYAPQQIESVSTQVGMTAGGRGGTPYYMVCLKIRGGSQATAAKYIRSRRDAEMLAAKIERDCGIETAHI